MDFDKDLQSIQEVRWLVAKAVVAQKELAKMSQQQVDGIAKAIADACAAQSERLAKMAVEETGFGIWQDKVLKNLLGSAITWDSVKDMKTVGIIKDDRQNGLMEVGVPMGVVAALIPSTNPTSTTMYKSIISIKAGNAIVISPPKTGGGDDCLHIIQGSFRRRRMRPMRAARRPQTKLRYRSILPPKTYVAVRQTQFFSRSTQIIARMVQFYAPAVTGLARRRQRCSACRAMGMRGQNKKDGARNANPVCKEIWRESLIT